ncbi:hypothetical protein L7F22_063728 [Adiantum nelumboides]|nr:hypothetical protein [Adiantum nelumboides]
METTIKWESWLSFVASAVLGATLIAVPALLYHKRVVDELIQQSHSRLNQSQRDPSKASHRGIGRRSRKDMTSVSMHEGVFVLEKDGQKLHRSSKHPDQEHSLDQKATSEVPFGALSSILSGLSRVQTVQEVDASGFEVEGGSEEDGIVNDQDEVTYDYEESNGNSLMFSAALLTKEDGVKSTVPSAGVIKDNSHGSVERTGNTMSRSHSIPGELHGIHAPDPVAADILRKEPEQECYVRLQVEPIEAPSTEEEEVCRLMQECLALREKYVFREKFAPWDMETVADLSTPKWNPDPFQYEQEPASKHVFQMIDGVVHVYSNEKGIKLLAEFLGSNDFCVGYVKLHTCWSIELPLSAA